MKSKKIIILTLIIASVAALYSCSNSNNKEISSAEESTIENNDSNENKNNKETDSTVTSTDKTKDSSSKKTTSSNQESRTKTDTPATTNNLIYKSKLGFSITFPSSWKDKYVIKDDSNSMYVYFKSSDPNTPKNSGLFFVIMKNTPSDQDFYDSIDTEKHITVGNKSYFVGGPTDVNLSENNKDFKLFLSMNQDRKKILDTIKPL